METDKDKSQKIVDKDDLKNGKKKGRGRGLPFTFGD